MRQHDDQVSPQCHPLLLILMQKSHFSVHEILDIR